MNIHDTKKEDELVWHDLEVDRAWFADHPDRQYHARPVLWGEGSATHLKGRVTQVTRTWFIVRRDLEYAAFSPVAAPIDDDNLCCMLFKAHVGLGRPRRQYLKKAQERWIALLDQMPDSKERELARARVLGEVDPRPYVRKTGGAADKVLAETLWQD